MRIDPQQLADREAIRECVLRYSRGVDRLDVEQMKSAYWPEATDDHGRFVGHHDRRLADLAQDRQLRLGRYGLDVRARYCRRGERAGARRRARDRAGL